MAAGARLFDLDGTLWDSYAFYSAIASEQGTITAEVARAALLGGENIVALMRRLALPRTRLSALLERPSPPVVPQAGMAEVLDELRRRGHPLAVVTNLAGWIAEPIVHHLGFSDVFRVVIHAGSRAGEKPNPQPILSALGRLGISDVSAAHAYIGDMEADHLAAARAGVRFAWATWGYGDAPAGVAVLRRPADILEL